MTCLPRIMFPDVVASFGAIQTCYFYHGMRIRFTWTSDGVLQWEENARVTQYTNTHIQCKHIHTRTCTRTDRHIARQTHRKIAGCGRILIRSADGCRRFLMFFSCFWLPGSVVDSSSFCHTNADDANLLGELLTFLCRSKAQRDGDECAPAAVRASFRVYCWLLLERACCSKGGLMKPNVAGEPLTLHYPL